MSFQHSCVCKGVVSMNAFDGTMTRMALRLEHHFHYIRQSWLYLIFQVLDVIKGTQTKDLYLQCPIMQVWISNHISYNVICLRIRYILLITREVHCIWFKSLQDWSFLFNVQLLWFGVHIHFSIKNVSATISQFEYFLSHCSPSLSK